MNKKLRMQLSLLLLALFCASTTIFAQSNRTETIDGTDNFTAAEKFSGTSGSTWAFTWDATNFYFSLNAPDVGSGSGDKFVYLYIDTDPQRNPLSGNGSAVGVNYNTQTPGLPFNADYHLRWKADNSYTNMLDYNNATSSWVDDNTGDLNDGITFTQSGNYVEFSIPRASLDNPTSIYVAGSMINEVGGGESTFFMLPSANNTDAYKADLNSFYGFDLSDGIVPNVPGALNTYPTASTTTGNVNVASNWTNGAPTSTDHAIIKSGNIMTLSTSGSVESLTILSGGTLIGSDGTDRVLNIGDGGAFSNYGTFTPTKNGTVDFNGVGSINGNATDFFNMGIQAIDVTLNATTGIFGRLNLSGVGDLISNGNLVIKSDATNTGMVVNLGTGIVAGDVSVERYLENQADDFFFAGYSAPSSGYHYISAPVSGSTIAGLNDDFTPVLTYPFSVANGGTGTGSIATLPNVFKYVESFVDGPFASNIQVGWDSPVDDSEGLNVGQGLLVRTPNNSTLDLVGTLNNTVGSDGLVVNLTRTNATGVENGWNLVGNPYPAPIEWNSIAKTNVEATIFMQIATGDYSAVWMSTNGTACNNCDNTDANTIPMMQGFFTRVMSGNTTGSLGFDNNDRKTAYENPAFYRTTGLDDLEGLLKLRIRNENSKRSDETSIAFAPNLTKKFDNDFDGSKFGLNGSGWPDIFTVLANSDKKICINGLPSDYEERLSVALTLNIGEKGVHTISAKTLAYFNAFTSVQLEDKVLKQTIDLKS